VDNCTDASLRKEREQKVLDARHEVAQREKDLKKAEKKGAAEKINKRKVLCKDRLKTSEDLGGMLRGRLPFDGLKFADGALKLDSLSHQPWQHFPEVRDGGDSAARAAVWERQARFHELARQLESVTGELVDVSRSQPLDAAQLKAPMDKVEAACKACHTEFRNH